MYDVVLLTESRYEAPSVLTPYIKDVLAEDGLVSNALEKRGLKVARVDWNHSYFDWSTASYALFRTTWDYFQKIQLFQRWLQKTSTLTSFINPYHQIQWNLDKTYLRDLGKKGINIPPTIFTDITGQQSLSDIINDNGWDKVVVKPAISASGRDTYLVEGKDAKNFEKNFRQLADNETMLVQPFQNEVITQGEKALMFIDGRFSHATLKVAKKGEFRVQSDFGGSVALYEASENEIDFGRQVLEACDEVPVYARVDIINDNQGRLCLVELELIEPEMWFRLYPTTADRLADAVTKHMSRN